MPGGDRTGPRGLGPMTGRGAGYCAGYTTPGYGRGLYFRRGPGNRFFGRGRGFRHMYWATGMPGWMGPVMYNQDINTQPGYQSMPGITPEQETEVLTKQAQAMQDQLALIQERLKELQSGKTDKNPQE